MIYPSLLLVSKFLVKQLMSRLIDFLPCSTSRSNVITPIVVPNNEFSTGVPRNVVRPRTAGHLRTNSAQSVTNRPLSSDVARGSNHITVVHSQNGNHKVSVDFQTNLPSQSITLRKDIQIVLGVTLKSKEEILTVLQNKFAAYEPKAD